MEYINKNVVDVSKHLEQIRREHGFSIKEFALLCGLSTDEYQETLLIEFIWNLERVEFVAKNIGVPKYVMLMNSLDAKSFKNPDDRRLVELLQNVANKLETQIRLKK